MPTAIDSGLASAVLRSDVAAARRLLNRGANINAVTTFSGDTILHLGVTSSSAMLAYLLEQRPQLEAVNDQGCTPLLKCATLQLTEPAIMLLEAGASISPRKDWVLCIGRMIPGRDSIYKVAQTTAYSGTIIEWFERSGRLSEIKDDLTEILSFAASNDEVEKCRLCLDAGADPRMGGASLCVSEEVAELLKSYELGNLKARREKDQEVSDGDDEVFFDACDTSFP